MLTTVKTIGDFEVLALIGDGGQANVYLCTKNNQLAAVKVFNAGSHKNEPFQRETKFLSVIKHQNLITMSGAQYEAVLKNKDGTSFKRSIIVLEFAQNGDLFEYISITKAFKPQLCRAIFKQLLSGIEYLNQHGIAHRDLKPQNVLFNDKFELKITDFGLSAYSEGADKDFVLTTKVGTEGFKAPEVDNGKYNGLKADIFAIGVILFCLYAGSPPFLTTRASDKMYRFIVNKNFEKFWSIHEKNRVKGYFSAGFKSLINSLLVSNPEQRMSIQQIKEHSWINDIKATQEQLKTELNLRFSKIVQESDLKKSIISLLKKREECSANNEHRAMQALICQVSQMSIKDMSNQSKSTKTQKH